jgi:hypothetical protein
LWLTVTGSLVWTSRTAVPGCPHAGRSSEGTAKVAAVGWPFGRAAGVDRELQPLIAAPAVSNSSTESLVGVIGSSLASVHSTARRSRRSARPTHKTTHNGVETQAKVVDRFDVNCGDTTWDRIATMMIPTGVTLASSPTPLA